VNDVGFWCLGNGFDHLTAAHAQFCASQVSEALFWKVDICFIQNAFFALSHDLCAGSKNVLVSRFEKGYFHGLPSNIEPPAHKRIVARTQVSDPGQP
jgi:hypothetical protein